MKPSERGFSMIELVVAMALFSFILIIIVMGFLTVVHLRDQSLAANAAQDNARTAMNEMVRAVRDSESVVSYTLAGPAGTAGSICLSKVGGGLISYKLAAGVLTRYNGCGPSATVSGAVTGTSTNVVFFEAAPETMGAGIVKPQIGITLTLASNNGTTNTSGAVTKCNANNQDRTFCSVVTLTSGAVPR